MGVLYPVRINRTQRWGDRLCFEGGISVQTTRPFGDPDCVRTEEVQAEVKELIAALGEGNGYSLSPIGCPASAAIQAGTPPEKRAALYDAAQSRYLLWRLLPQDDVSSAPHSKPNCLNG